MLKSTNPYTGKEIEKYQELNSGELNEKIEIAHNAHLSWKFMDYNARGEKMKLLANSLLENKQELAELITFEMGKILRESVAEIEKCAWLCNHYAENSASYLDEEFIVSDASKSYVKYEPIGVIYGIMPWNFPFWQVFRAAVPTIMAGNTFVLKHSPNVIGCGLAIENLFLKAGFPEGIFVNLKIDIDLSEEVIANDFIQGVTLTGSRRAGSAVAAQAGKYLKKTVMELGGSDPYIVMKDADFNTACQTGVSSRMLNSGQVCISAKRFIVEEEIFEDFVQQQKLLLESLSCGAPMDYDTDIGPMARIDLLETIELQVNKSVAMGAKLICGGDRIDNKFYAPTLLINVEKGMPVYDEETFGPVSIVIPAKDKEEMLRIANDTNYGLGASIWTNDSNAADYLANNIHAGAVFVNGMTKSDPRLPFGGTKQSGYGRELAGLGIREFTNAKTIWIK